MPHRIVELERIASELFQLGKRATDIGEMQLAKGIVDAIAISHASKTRIAEELKGAGATDTEASP